MRMVVLLLASDIQKAAVIRAVQGLTIGALQVEATVVLEVARTATVQPQLTGRVVTVAVMALMDKPSMRRVVSDRVRQIVVRENLRKILEVFFPVVVVVLAIVHLKRVALAVLAAVAEDMVLQVDVQAERQILVVAAVVTIKGLLLLALAVLVLSSSATQDKEALWDREHLH